MELQKYSIPSALWHLGYYYCYYCCFKCLCLCDVFRMKCFLALFLPFSFSFPSFLVGFAFFFSFAHHFIFIHLHPTCCAIVSIVWFDSLAFRTTFHTNTIHNHWNWCRLCNNKENFLCSFFCGTHIVIKKRCRNQCEKHRRNYSIISNSYFRNNAYYSYLPNVEEGLPFLRNLIQCIRKTCKICWLLIVRLRKRKIVSRLWVIFGSKEIFIII